MNSTNIRSQITDTLAKKKAAAWEKCAALSDRVLLTDYEAMTTERDGGKIWTSALRRALDEHEVIVIPPRDDPYFIDDKITIPSNRHIIAAGAELKLTADCTLCMFTCESAADGTHYPITTPRGSNITITGGHFSESRSGRGGYGSSGKFDPERTFFGVSTLFYFGNINDITITDAEFSCTAGFAVQIGDVDGAFFENIKFTSCFADGLHINGNTKNLICRNISGEVGDDLVALNAYDWQNSSVNFGPIDTVLLENLSLAETSRYKALRIEPGTYWYDDGSSLDCALRNAIIRSVRGIRTFKLYYQTPPYKLGTKPERGAVGSADNLFFEDIDIDLADPIDHFGVYMNSDPIRGSFAAFEIGANIGFMRLDDIRITLYKDTFPYSYLLCCGPKSVLSGDNEVFDPYLSSRIDTLELSNIIVNGNRADSADELIREIRFDDINNDGHSTALGEISEIVLI